jgi:hypothetical protein
MKSASRAARPSTAISQAGDYVLTGSRDSRAWREGMRGVVCGAFLDDGFFKAK